MATPAEALENYRRHQEQEKERDRQHRNAPRHLTFEEQYALDQQTRITKLDPLGFLISEITRLVTDDIKVQKQLNQYIEKNGTTTIPLFDTEDYYTIFMGYEFAKKCGYEQNLCCEYRVDVKKQSEHTSKTTVFIEKGPYEGWKINFSLHHRRSSGGIHAHGYSGGSSRYVYTAELYYPSSCIIS